MAKKNGLPILARFRSFACVGVDPKLMGIGPAFAIPPALTQADFDLWFTTGRTKREKHEMVELGQKMVAMFAAIISKNVQCGSDREPLNE